MQPAYLSWLGRPLLDRSGEAFGTVADVLVGADEEPVWAETSPADGGRPVLVPVAGLRETPAGVQVPHSAETLASAPRTVVGDGPSAADEDALRRHFVLAAPGLAAPGQQGDDERASVVRAEEQLRISTQVRPTGTVRLRKWVETSTVAEELVLHSERLLVQRLPVDLTNIDAVQSHAEIGEAVYEVVLRDEELVATKVTVPVEVIRLSKQVVQETVLVEADLAHEEVEVQTDDVEQPATRGQS